jgi:MFS family permease
MLATYRRVLAHPGAFRFSATGLLARLPMSMVGLGIVLLVSEETGSYGLAGTVSATFLLAEALMSIVIGRLVDARGQGLVLAVAVVLSNVGLVIVIASIQSGWPLAVAYAGAALAGMSMPPVGACVRARWSYILGSKAQLQTAFALEAVVDEVVFIVGPILVTVLATSVHPLAGLGSAVVAGLVGTLALAAQRSTAPPSQRTRGADGDAERPPMPWRTVLPLFLVTLMLGAFFGAAEVATVAFADERDAKPYTGVLLGIWAAGSLAAGLITGAITWRVGAGSRLRRGSVALTLVMAPMVFIDSVPLMGGALFLAGFAVAPTLISALALTEETVPAARLTEGMTVIHTGIVAGVAPGATLAGIVIDASGASPAYLVAVASGLLAALVSTGLPKGSAPGEGGDDRRGGTPSSYADATLPLA